MNNPNKHINLYIHGKVQGVWYRKSCQAKAQELGLTGFVKNQADGSVYCEVEGDVEQLMAMVDWCKKGPKLASVEKVRIIDGSIKEFEEFLIK